MPQQLNPVVLSLEMHIALEIPFRRYQWFGSKLSSYSVACTSGEFLKKNSDLALPTLKISIKN